MESPLVVGWVASPRKWERWPEVEALLEPARLQADDLPSVLDEHDVLWVAMDGDQLMGVATTVLLTNRSMEVTLVGGRDYRRWIKQLNDELGREARAAGAARLVAYGRQGWRRVLGTLGWEYITMNDGTAAYSRTLGA